MTVAGAPEDEEDGFDRKYHKTWVQSVDTWFANNHGYSLAR